MSKSYNGRAMLFWTRVDSICKKEKMTLASMIPALFVSPRTFYNWRITDRTPPAGKVLKMARILGVSPYYLVFGEELENTATHSDMDFPSNGDPEPETMSTDRILGLIDIAIRIAGDNAIHYLKGYIEGLKETNHE
jgi:hypothetical protein